MSAGTPPGSLRHGLLMSLAAAGTTWLAMLSWRGFGETPFRYLGPLLGALAHRGVTRDSVFAKMDDCGYATAEQAFGW